MRIRVRILTNQKRIKFAFANSTKELIVKRSYLFLVRSYVSGKLFLKGDKAELDSDKMQGLVKMGAVQALPEPVAPAVTTTQSVETVAPVTALTPNVPVVATLPPVEPTEPTAVEPVVMDTVEPTGATAIQATGTQDSPSNDTNVYGNLTKAQLNAELDKRGIAHDPKAINAELEALLVADDEQKAAATALAPVTPNP